MATGDRTLFVQLPEPRATNDVDLFIRAEILADAEQASRIATAICGLGYVPVANAKYLQWTRSVTIGGIQKEVKLDLLVGPLGVHHSRIKTNPPRARPKGKSVGLHAYRTEEALALEAAPWEIPLSGQRTTGEPCDAVVCVPRAFPYLMMKLFAFQDRKADPRKDVGRHHALDLYTIVGMMTEAEYAQALDQGRQLAADSHVAIARQVVATDFSETIALGILRLREHPLFQPGFQVQEFIGVLRDVFTP